MRRGVTWLLFVGFGLLLSSALFFYRQELEIQELALWIKRHAVSLNSAEPFLDDASFGSVASDFEGSKVVAIGESTHGTHEFDVLKLEFLKHMVKNGSCRMLALEAGFASCWLVNGQLSNPDVSVDSLVRLLGFENLQTMEFRRTLLWLRDYNMTFPEDPVVLVGFDIQANQVAIPMLASFFSSVSAPLTTELIQCVRKMGRAKVTSEEPELPALAVELSRIVMELRASTNDAQELWPFEMEMSLRILHQYALSYGAKDIQLASYKRDSCMAVNVRSWLNQLPSNRMMLVSAHNGHIREHAESFFPMGRWLSQDLGSDYFTIGLDFHRGSFRANDPSERNSPGWEVIDAEPSMVSIASIFSRAGKPNSFLLLGAGNHSQTVMEWIYVKPLLMNSAGSISVNSFFNDDTAREVVGKAFDSIIILGQSTPTEPLR